MREEEEAHGCSDAGVDIAGTAAERAMSSGKATAMSLSTARERAGAAQVAPPSVQQQQVQVQAQAGRRDSQLKDFKWPFRDVRLGMRNIQLINWDVRLPFFGNANPEDAVTALNHVYAGTAARTISQVETCSLFVHVYLYAFFSLWIDTGMHLF